jgi:hypothetical protein
MNEYPYRHFSIPVIIHFQPVDRLSLETICRLIITRVSVCTQRFVIGVARNIGVPLHVIRCAANCYWKLCLNISTFTELNLLCH